MKNPIYKPSGAAAEYGEYALNIYDGCPHGCPYCYVPLVLRKNREAFHANVTPRPGIVEETRKQLERTGMTGETIFLCFTCDPFPTGYDCTPTLDIIRLLKAHGNHVKILTKGDGTPCLDLLDENDWYGITLDGTEKWPGEYTRRYAPLWLAKKDHNVKTWISFEPVLRPRSVLTILSRLETVDTVKIGKLNYGQPPKPVDWGQFGRDAEELCQRMGLDYYVKDSLRKEMQKSSQS